MTPSIPSPADDQPGGLLGPSVAHGGEKIDDELLEGGRQHRCDALSKLRHKSSPELLVAVLHQVIRRTLVGRDRCPRGGDRTPGTVRIIPAPVSVGHVLREAHQIVHSELGRVLRKCGPTSVGDTVHSTTRRLDEPCTLQVRLGPRDAVSERRLRTAWQPLGDFLRSEREFDRQCAKRFLPCALALGKVTKDWKHHCLEIRNCHLRNTSAPRPS